MRTRSFVRTGLSRVLLTALLVLAGATTAGAGIMTFESAAAPVLYGDGGVSYWFTEQGINLWTDAMWVEGPPPNNNCGGGGCVTNGTNVGVIYRATLTAGSLFDLNSLDYSKSFASGYTTLVIEGQIAGGGQYTTELTLDLANGFQTANLNWVNLTSVSLSGRGATGLSSYFTVDNIDATSIPDAGSTLLLLGSALLAAGWARRKWL